MRFQKERESTNFIVKVRKMRPSKKDFRNVAGYHRVATKYARDRTNWKEDYYGEEESD